MSAEQPVDEPAGKYQRALYAGSFDPPTNGHLWLIERGAELFDELHVAVAFNPNKLSSKFTVVERVEMLEEIAAPHQNVRISSFGDRFTVNYARNLGCRYLLRGLRNAQDYDSEQTLGSLNRDIGRDTVETVFLSGPDELLKISSSAVKGMVGPEGWETEVARYVPEFVLNALIRQRTSQTT